MIWDGDSGRTPWGGGGARGADRRASEGSLSGGACDGRSEVKAVREEQASSAGGAWVVVRKVILCLFLTGVGVASVVALRGVAERAQPFVDLSQGREAAPAGSVEDVGSSLRFAVATMVSAEATFSTYRELVDRISRDVGRTRAFVLRPSYAEVRVALEGGKVDVALVCTGTYIHTFAGGQATLLVQPEFVEGLEYRSVLIVPTSSPAQRWEDLRGKVMAFTDRESHTGHLVPLAMLKDRGLAPESFFGKVTFTGSHDRSIESVMLRIADAAAVDSLIWESVKKQDPSASGRVRVIWESDAFGPPPVMVPKELDESLKESLREAFLGLDDDEEGRRVLFEIGIKRFVTPRVEDYLSSLEVYRRLHERSDEADD